MKATMQSSSAFSIGIERVIAEASAPSASSHLPLRLHAGLLEQIFSGTPVYIDVVHHAVRELAAVELRAAPLHAGVGRAFEEVDAVHAPREALEVVHREHQRLVDEAVDHQPVLGRIDFSRCPHDGARSTARSA
jgi:hypothetical protein